MSRTLVVCLFLLSLMFSGPAAHAAPIGDQEKQRIERSLSQTRRSLDLQTKFPENTLPPVATPQVDTRVSLFSPETAQIILYLGLAVLLTVLLLSLKDTMWSSSRSRRLHADPEEEAAQAEAVIRLEQAGTEADHLAAGGSFKEAMHTLLLQTLAELRRRLEFPMAVSLTSREILARVGLSADLSLLFSDIIGRVEVCHFGPHEPDADDYAACRASYESLCRSLRQEGER